MSKYYKSEGGLWPNKEKKAQNHPDMTGKVDLTREQLKGLIAMAKKGETPKIKLASWSRKAQDTGEPYQYVSGEVFWDAEETAPAPPPPPPVPEPQPILTEEDDIPF